MKVVRVLDLKLMLVTVFFVKLHFIDETTTKKREKICISNGIRWKFGGKLMETSTSKVEVWWKFDGNFHL